MICFALNRFSRCYWLARMAVAAFLFIGGVYSFARGESIRRPARLIVQPGAIELRGPHADHGILVTAVMADGQTTDATALVRFTSRQAGIVTVSTNGHCVAVADGQTEILVEHLGRRERVSIVVTNAALVRVPSF